MSEKPVAGPSGTSNGPRAQGPAADRPLSKLSLMIWNMVGKAKNQTMLEPQVVAALNQSGKPKVPLKEIQEALVDLIKKAFLATHKAADGARVFKWQAKEGADSLDATTPEMRACWGHIRQAGNKGLTAKQIRTKIGQDRITPIAIRKALDGLVRNKQIKTFKSIQHPTMQLYVLFDVVPDEGMTGGIWYDGNKEYDTAFVNGICKHLLSFVRAKSWPNNDKRLEAKKLVDNPLYPPGRGPNLPSPGDLLKYCIESKVVNSNVPLTQKNIMECMRALELDGLVEVVKPTYQVTAGSDDEWQPRAKRAKLEDSDDEMERKAEMKRMKEKEKARRRLEAKKAKEKEKRRREREREREKKRRKKEKKRREKEKRKRKDDSGEESDDPLVDLNDLDSGKARKRKRSSTVSSASSDSESSDSESDSDVSVSSLDSDALDQAMEYTDDELDGPKATREASEPEAILERMAVHNAAFGHTNLTSLDDDQVVYRAVRRAKFQLSHDQVPCGKCPQFSFCDSVGPVNPDNCVYYEDYLADINGGWDSVGKARYRPELVAAQKAEAEAAAAAAARKVEEATQEEAEAGGMDVQAE